MVCHRCQTQAFKFGFHKGFQRYRCKECGKTFSDLPARPLDELRIRPEQAYQVIHLLCEGVGIRACERLCGLNRRTVLNVLELAGERCARLLDYKVRAFCPTYVEVDEIWSFVQCKQAKTVKTDLERGDQYTFLAMDAPTKLLIHHHIAKRNGESALEFMHGLRNRTGGLYNLTSDGYKPYQGSRGAVFQVFGHNVNHGTEVKRFGVIPTDTEGYRRYSPPVCTGIWRKARIGTREPNTITVNHMERGNLTIRLFNRRFTRLTLGFSKKLANLKHAVALFVAHYNFCRVHGSLDKRTPAMSAGLADHVWTIAELLSNI